MFEVRKTFLHGQLYPNTEYFRSVGLAGKPHLGTDWLTPVGTPIYAPDNGTIKHEYSKAIGYAIHFIDKYGVLTRFLHLSKYEGKPRKVTKGELIGFTGNTGISTAPHCHVDCWKTGKYTGRFENTLNPEIYWAKPIRVKVLYEEEGKIERLEAVKDWYRFTIPMTFDYQYIPSRIKPLKGRFIDEELAYKVIPYASGYDIALHCTTEPLEGVHGYHDNDDYWDIRYCAIDLDYALSRKNFGFAKDMQLEGTARHELAHALYEMQGTTDNTHDLDYSGRAEDILKELDPRKMTRNENEYMFKYGYNYVLRREPVVGDATFVYRSQDHSLYLAYRKDWVKITKEEFETERANGLKSMVLGDGQIARILEDSDIDYELKPKKIVGRKGNKVLLYAQGYRDSIPTKHLT